MKQFEKCLEKVGGGDPFCCEPLAEVIWRECLEWVKKEAISLDERGDISRGVINRELES